MTRCASERDWPGLGLGWTPPEGLGQDPDAIRFETKRLVVRMYALRDAEAMFASVDRCRSELAQWMDWVHVHTTLDHSREYVLKNRLGVRDLLATTSLGLGVFDKASREHLGGTGFHGLQATTASAEFGYWIRSDRTGQGFAAEANGALLSWMLRPAADGGLGFVRARAFCAGGNPGSRRVLEKLGLPLEVVQRGDLFGKSAGVGDRIGFGVLRDEWDFSAHRALSKTPTTRLPG